MLRCILKTTLKGEGCTRNICRLTVNLEAHYASLPQTLPIVRFTILWSYMLKGVYEILRLSGAHIGTCAIPPATLGDKDIDCQNSASWLSSVNYENKALNCTTYRVFHVASRGMTIAFDTHSDKE